MEIAIIPDDEAGRVQALMDYAVLDTAPEQVFDDLVKLASDICETPIALMSLVDPTRQWFKASVGLPAKETSRDIAFCSHAILENGILEVQDTLLDPRFRDNPLVEQDPNIRFYAGAPLITPDGYKIGTLCAIDCRPKVLDYKQKVALRTLSQAIMSQLELRKSMQQLRKKEAEVEAQNQMLECISRVQSNYINSVAPTKLFSELLSSLLQLTESEYGFIGEVLYSQERKPYLKTRAITNIAWDQETTRFFAENAPSGLEFTNLHTLFGHVLVTHKPVISTDPSNDSRSGGLPNGHPELKQFLGIPLFSGDKFVGMVGVANGKETYSDGQVEYLKPFLKTCAQMISACQLKEKA